ncbi:MAG: radical SAM protein [Rhodocyclaceae bacterium]|nr:radical SAM protein [Rhodocyclaceae bacterium]
MLTTTDHRRDYSGFRYVYPVVSRRAGGVSVGINLNPNNACNWACVYCQVPNLSRGGPPPIDLAVLASELDAMLTDIVHGDFMAREVPDGARRLMDIAFSGNGEPTSAAEFADAVALVIGAMQRHHLLPDVKLRLITNGSLIHREDVQRGLAGIADADGEVWFKIDRATAAGIAAVNKTSVSPAKAAETLARCAELAPTWVQTCWFALDGQAPDEAEKTAYLVLLQTLAQKIRGVHLYGLARPSLQPEAARIGRLPVAEMSAFADRIRALGIEVSLNP